MVVNPVLLYWDTSALISALIEDEHTEKAMHWLKVGGGHLVSSLAFVELYAVLYRVQRESGATEDLAEKAQEEFLFGPWKRLNLLPDWSLFKPLAQKWSLRGADLWHLAAAKTASRNFPELKLISFDRNLAEAARGEKLAL
jgi:predicted nucleic acid-binding protein